KGSGGTGSLMPSSFNLCSALTGRDTSRTTTCGLGVVLIKLSSLESELKLLAAGRGPFFPVSVPRVASNQVCRSRVVFAQSGLDQRRSRCFLLLGGERVREFSWKKECPDIQSQPA